MTKYLAAALLTTPLFYVHSIGSDRLEQDRRRR